MLSINIEIVKILQININALSIFLTAINGGFFVVNPEFFDFISGDQTILEKEPLEKATATKQLKTR